MIAGPSNVIVARKKKKKKKKRNNNKKKKKKKKKNDIFITSLIRVLISNMIIHYRDEFYFC